MLPFPIFRTFNYEVSNERRLSLFGLALLMTLGAVVGLGSSGGDFTESISGTEIHSLLIRLI